MKIGDKVRFLNTTGGGIIKGFRGKDIVLVEDEEGFDIPVLVREAVIIEPANDMQVRQSNKSAIQAEPHSKPTAKQEDDYKPEETKEGEQLTVLLSYLPVDVKSLSTTNFECYLINDSNYYLSYNYMSRADSGWISRAAGIIEPNTKLFLEEFEKADLNDIGKVCLQFFAYKKDKAYFIKNVYSVEVRIDTVKFYKLHSFKENDYFEDDAMVYPIVRRDLAEKELVISPEEIASAMKEKESGQRPRIQPIVKKEKNPVLEIDLHADELLDSTNGLSAADILEYQLGKFREIMNENKRNKGQKIVFIHGKGNGILKNAILKELNTHYKPAYYQDASFREYGYGATMVTIK
jgi:hypothetical protein